eukprot:m.60709 g.60709  ORF g.60709 m.60709 type:complete len:297 (-) comp9522_c0_seq1:205-1095(-)
MLGVTAFPWPSDPLDVHVDAPPALHDTGLCGKTTPDMFNSMLSREDELQSLISEIVTEQQPLSSENIPTSLQISPLWNWGSFGSFSDSKLEGSFSPGDSSGSEAVVPNMDPNAMQLDGQALLPPSPISSFFFDQRMSPGTPQRHHSGTPETFAPPTGLMMAARALSYDDTIGAEHTTPPHGHNSRLTATPRTPQKKGKRAAKQAVSPSKSRVKRAVKAKPVAVVVEEETGVRGEKSKQSARECRRRKKLYIEAVQAKAKEYAERHQKRLDRIKELKEAIAKLEHRARALGLDPSRV